MLGESPTAAGRCECGRDCGLGAAVEHGPSVAKARVVGRARRGRGGECDFKRRGVALLKAI